jgi:hypothetical protein
VTAAPVWRVWAALWIVYLVWGSTYLAIRIMVETVPPLLGAGVRFAIAGAVMLAVLAVHRSVRPTRAQLLSALLTPTRWSRWPSRRCRRRLRRC